MSLIFFLLLLQDRPQLQIDPAKVEIASHALIVFGDPDPAQVVEYEKEVKACRESKEICLVAANPFGNEMCRIDDKDVFTMAPGVTAAQCIRRIVKYQSLALEREQSDCARIVNQWRESEMRFIKSGEKQYLDGYKAGYGRAMKKVQDAMKPVAVKP